MVIFRSLMGIQRSGNLAATSRRSSVVTSQHRDVWSTEEKVKERPNVATFQRSRDFCFKIIKSTGYLIFWIIDGRTDEERRAKQQQPEISKRLCFCIHLLKTINDL